MRMAEIQGKREGLLRQEAGELTCYLFLSPPSCFVCLLVCLFVCFLTAPTVACGSSQAKDRTHATAIIRGTAVAILDP